MASNMKQLMERQCCAPSVAHLPFYVLFMIWMGRGLLCPEDAKPVAPILEVVKECITHQSLMC